MALAEYSSAEPAKSLKRPRFIIGAESTPAAAPVALFNICLRVNKPYPPISRFSRERIYHQLLQYVKSAQQSLQPGRPCAILPAYEIDSYRL
jgi:hypothetical protein